MKKILSKLKQKTGFSLTELVVTTAVMGTLAAVAVPKFSNVSESAKYKKTEANIDNIVQAGMQYYNEQVISKGRGSFPGQGFKHTDTVGGGTPTLATDGVKVFGSTSTTTNGVTTTTDSDWDALFDGTIDSPYQDKMYMYAVEGAGTGTGELATSPTLYVWDSEDLSTMKSLTP